MNCLHAQEMLSEAFDRETTDPAMLAAARDHCRTCAECAAFARGLELLERAALPQLDVALADRVVAAVRAQAAPQRPAVADIKTRRPELWRVGAWVGVAATVLVVAGFAAVGGVRSILAPTAATRDSASLQKSESTDDRVAGSTPPTAPEALANGAAESATAYSDAAAQAAASFISVDGVAYRYLGIEDVPASSLTTAGSAITSLDTRAAAQSYTVYATPAAGRVAVLSAGGTRVFELVKRTLEGRTYVLSAGDLSGFGEWPGLPAGFTQPTTPEGAPTFVPAGLDDLGVQTFSKPGTPIEDGFAIAPGTTSSDPALGSPNWTWWARPR